MGDEQPLRSAPHSGKVIDQVGERVASVFNLALTERRRTGGKKAIRLTLCPRRRAIPVDKHAPLSDHVGQRRPTASSIGLEELAQRLVSVNEGLDRPAMSEIRGTE